MNIITKVSLIHWYIAKYSKKLWILVSFTYDAVRKKERNNGSKEENKYKWRTIVPTQKELTPRIQKQLSESSGIKCKKWKYK